MRRYIYLISPQEIRGIKFYNQLDQVLQTKKVSYFQLRLKNITNLNFIKIAKKVKIIANGIININVWSFSINNFFIAGSNSQAIAEVDAATINERKKEKIIFPKNRLV